MQPDINAAFVYGELKEKIYIELPPGYCDQKEHQITLCKAEQVDLWTCTISAGVVHVPNNLPPKPRTPFRSMCLPTKIGTTRP